MKCTHGIDLKSIESRAPQGARGLKLHLHHRVIKCPLVAPRKGRVG